MKIVASTRQKLGTGASRRLRNAGITPGIVYGGDNEPELIEIDHNHLFHSLRKEAFHSSILDLELDGKTQKVLLRDAQVHPFKRLVMHVDFLRINPKEAITINVPLHYLNAEESPAVSLDKALVNHIYTELEISCLPADLPESIEVDLSQVQLHDVITLADIQLPAGVEAVLRGQEAENITLVTVTPPVLEEVDEPAEDEDLLQDLDAAPEDAEDDDSADEEDK